MSAADRARARLVDGLRGGVLREAAEQGGHPTHRRIEDAFRAVPRHLFLPGVPLARAYADEAVPVQSVDGVTTSSASQPSMMAIMLDQLDLRPGHRVLEIGAGTGYNAALMARLVGPAGRVVAVDIDPELVDGAARHLAEAGVEGVALQCGDGALGHAPEAPYDRIVLTVGSGDVRPEWVAQLAPGGRLLLPLAVRGTQLSVALDLGPDGLLRSHSVHRCGFVRLRGVAAVSEQGAVVDGVAVVPAGDGAVPVAALRTALASPGALRPCPVPLGPADRADGFGLWLALTEPGTLRLLAARSCPDEPAPGTVADLLGVAPGRGTVALLREEPAGPGFAAVLIDPPAGTERRGPRPVHVRAFGPTGDAVADRVVAAASGWAAAGRPTAADLHLTVVPAGVAAPDTAADAAVATVEKASCRVLVGVGAPA